MYLNNLNERKLITDHEAHFGYCEMDIRTRKPLFDMVIKRIKSSCQDGEDKSHEIRSP